MTMPFPVPAEPPRRRVPPAAPSAKLRANHARPGDDLLAVAGHYWQRDADCCAAHPTFRVVFRREDPDAAPAELFLCGHHYRASTAQLLERRASVYDAAHRLLASFGGLS